MDITTITVDKSTRRRLEKLKRYDRESLNEVLVRLLSGSVGNFDRESFSETVAVLSDPETMKRLARSVESFEIGKKTYSIDEV